MPNSASKPSMVANTLSPVSCSSIQARSFAKRGSLQRISFCALRWRSSEWVSLRKPILLALTCSALAVARRPNSRSNASTV